MAVAWVGYTVAMAFAVMRGGAGARAIPIASALFAASLLGLWTSLRRSWFTPVFTTMMFIPVGVYLVGVPHGGFRAVGVLSLLLFLSSLWSVGADLWSTFQRWRREHSS